MRRAIWTSLALVVLAGCQLPEERAQVRPLPEDAAPQPYADLLTRARRQAEAATEAFYVNNWDDLKEIARTLEQTARFLSRATDVPEKHRDTLPAAAADLGKDATLLRDSALKQDVKQTSEILQRLNLKVRELRLEN